jgi:hypothetical protein
MKQPFVIHPLVERSALLAWLARIPHHLARYHEIWYPKKIRIVGDFSSGRCKAESVLDVADPNFGAVQQYADHIEPIELRLPPVAVDPDERRALQLLAFPIVDCLDRTAKLRALPSLDLDKCNNSIPLHDQIDVAMAALEASLDNPPTAPPKPPLRYSLSELAECLPGR